MSVIMPMSSETHCKHRN